MIRPYQESDLFDIIELLDLLRNSKEASGFEDILFNPDSYREIYFVKKIYKTFVAIDERVIGFILSEHYCNDVLGVIMLYVHPTFRRKQTALKLKSAIADYAKKNSYKQIVSQVRTNNPESIKMNQRAGWVISTDRVYPDYYVECSKGL